jgi:hypothetical protein
LYYDQRVNAQPADQTQALARLHQLITKPDTSTPPTVPDDELDAGRPTVLKRR